MVRGLASLRPFGQSERRRPICHQITAYSPQPPKRRRECVIPLTAPVIAPRNDPLAVSSEDSGSNEPYSGILHVNIVLPLERPSPPLVLSLAVHTAEQPCLKRKTLHHHFLQHSHVPNLHAIARTPNSISPTNSRHNHYHYSHSEDWAPASPPPNSQIPSIFVQLWLTHVPESVSRTQQPQGTRPANLQPYNLISARLACAHEVKSEAAGKFAEGSRRQTFQLPPTSPQHEAPAGEAWASTISATSQTWQGSCM